MIFEKVKALVDEQFVYEGDLSRETRVIEDLGADSFDIPVFFNALEDELGIAIKNEEILSLKTLGDLLALIEEKLNNQEE